MTVCTTPDRDFAQITLRCLRLPFVLLLLCAALLGACQSSPAPPSPPSTFGSGASVPFPTAVSQRRIGGSGEETVFAMSGTILNVALATHPTDGWPAVAIAQRYGESADPIRIFTRVYDPNAGRWGIAQQIDTGPSSAGTDRFGDVQLAITGDNTITVVWGASDDFRTGAATTRLWASFSRDFGVTWKEPFPIASNCRRPVAMASTAPGWVAVLAQCYTGPIGAPSGEIMRLIVRDGYWQWHPPEDLPGPAWYGTEGAIAMLGQSTAPIITVLTLGKLPAGTVYLNSRPAHGGTWRTISRRVAVAGDKGSGVFVQARSASYGRPLAQGASGAMFTWTITERPGLYALSTANGSTWGNIEQLRAFGATDQTFISGIAPAYEPRADTLVALWGCCGSTRYAYNENTHVFSTRPAATSGTWKRTSEPYVPLITGARSAGPLAVAQAQNGSMTWIGWIEQLNKVIVRSVNLGDLLSHDDYPAPTPAPTFGAPTPTP